MRNNISKTKVEKEKKKKEKNRKGEGKQNQKRKERQYLEEKKKTEKKTEKREHSECNVSDLQCSFSRLGRDSLTCDAADGELAETTSLPRDASRRYDGDPIPPRQKEKKKKRKKKKKKKKRKRKKKEKKKEKRKLAERNFSHRPERRGMIVTFTITSVVA